jgi:hypothetical protein
MFLGTATQEVKPTVKKKIVNYYISEPLLNRFRQVCDKESRNYSKVIENFMMRYTNK